MANAIIVIGMFNGDCGKGSITDFLCEEKNADLVIKYTGGHGCGHTVCRDTRRHIFSQFGSGTLLEVPTYLDKNFVTDPLALSMEAKALSELGIANPYSLLTIHPRCLVTIPYFRDLNRAKCKNKNCSTGTGMWETIRYSLSNREDSIYFEDLYDYIVLREKVKNIKKALSNEYWRYSGYDFEWHHDKIVDELQQIANKLEYKKSPSTFNFAIFEGSQGAILDAKNGFYPFNCATPTTGRYAVERLSQLKIRNYTSIGVARAYLTRHGAGPLPTETNKIKINNMVPENEYAGPFRLGWFDFKLLQYSLQINYLDGCGINSLAITCLDHMGDEPIQYCQNYKNKIEYKIPMDLDDAQENTMRAFKAEPEYKQCHINQLVDNLESLFNIEILSRGETAKDKIWV